MLRQKVVNMKRQNIHFFTYLSYYIKFFRSSCLLILPPHNLRGHEGMLCYFEQAAYAVIFSFDYHLVHTCKSKVIQSTSSKISQIYSSFSASTLCRSRLISKILHCTKKRFPLRISLVNVNIFSVSKSLVEIFIFRRV